MMKITGYWIIGCILLGGIACTDEKECSREMAGAEGRFKMQDVAYAFEGDEARITSLIIILPIGWNYWHSGKTT